MLFEGWGGGPRVVVSTAAFHARVRGSVPGLGGLKETKMFLPHPRVKVSIVGSLRDREVACSASDRQGSSFESCVWRTVSSQSSHHPQEALLAQFSLYVHKGGLKPDSFHLFEGFIGRTTTFWWTALQITIRCAPNNFACIPNTIGENQMMRCIVMVLSLTIYFLAQHSPRGTVIRERPNYIPEGSIHLKFNSPKF